MKVSLQIGNPAQRFLSTDVIFYALYQFLIAVNGNSHLKLSAVIGRQGGEVDIKNKLRDMRWQVSLRLLRWQGSWQSRKRIHREQAPAQRSRERTGRKRSAQRRWWCIPKPKPHKSSVYFSSKQLTLSVDDASRRLMEIVSAKSGFIRSKNEKENLYKNGRWKKYSLGNFLIFAKF